jgi:histidinol dehydrogenase
MTAVPALVAGVPEVVVCVPPDRTTGQVAAVTLAAAAVAGVTEVYAVGGAQAVAAMAYGTESVAPVDVICGPGNRYVALAKQEVAGTVGVAAAFAGPSEVVVVADASVPADFAAVDVILQAEHGPDGLAWLITWDEAVADAVTEAVAVVVGDGVPPCVSVDVMDAVADEEGVMVDDSDGSTVKSTDAVGVAVDDAEAVSEPVDVGVAPVDSDAVAVELGVSVDVGVMVGCVYVMRTLKEPDAEKPAAST